MLPRQAEESVWGGLSLPQQALETASMSQPAAAPHRWAPRLLAFSGKAEAASAPNHGPATLGLSSGCCPRVRSLTFKSPGPAQLSLDLFPRFFSFFFFGLSLFLSPSCILAPSAGSHPIWICSRAQFNLYFPLFLGIWKF